MNKAIMLSLMLISSQVMYPVTQKEFMELLDEVTEPGYKYTIVGVAVRKVWSTGSSVWGRLSELTGYNKAN